MVNRVCGLNAVSSSNSTRIPKSPIAFLKEPLSLSHDPGNWASGGKEELSESLIFIQCKITKETYSM